MKRVLLFFSVILISCHNNNSQESSAKAATLQKAWQFKGIRGSKLEFIDGSHFDTHLYDLKYIGKIEATGKQPYFIVSGQDCDGCDENTSLYFHSPSDGEMKVSEGQNRYDFPGLEKDYETEEPNFSTRVFYGEVLPNCKGLIWYRSDYLPNGQIAYSTFFAKISRKGIEDVSYKGVQKMGTTIRLVKKGLCNEIPGQEFSSEP
jgi:hypothetical protein